MYCVIDLETTIKSVNKRFCNPFTGDNRVVALGCKLQNENLVRLYHEVDACPYSAFFEILLNNNITTLVGHNIKFDLLFLWNSVVFQNWMVAGGKIWDTQLCEYILTGQEFIRAYNVGGKSQSMHGLRFLANRKYNQPEREKLMEPYWNNKACFINSQGYIDATVKEINTRDPICTSKIPKDLVLQDLEWDCLDTEAILLYQYEEAKITGKLPLLEVENKVLLVTCEMEFNGLYVNNEKLEEIESNIFEKLEKIKKSIEDITSFHWKFPEKFNLLSNQHVSLLFFGGFLEEDKVELVGNYKNGKSKYKKIKYLINQSGIVKKVSKIKSEKSNFCTVDEAVLLDIVKRESSDISLIAKSILEYRALEKLYTTYCVGIKESYSKNNPIIHHSLNHTVTQTSRLSSSNPNMQNIPRKDNSEIKKIFSSRFGADGVILEFDYKQLEFTSAALLYNDKILEDELNSGVDIYISNAPFIFGAGIVSKEQRTIMKTLMLALLYGRGVVSLSSSTGLSFEVCKDFIDKFYNKYKGIAHNHKLIIDSARVNKYLSDEKSYLGYPVCKYKYNSIAGQSFVFFEKDVPEFLKRKGIKVGFNPPDLKNWPNQGFGALCVKLGLVELFKSIINNRDSGALINTVHDSVLLDVKLDYLDFWIPEGKSKLESIPNLLKQHFNIDTEVQFKVECKYGKTWFDC